MNTKDLYIKKLEEYIGFTDNCYVNVPLGRNAAEYTKLRLELIKLQSNTEKEPALSAEELLERCSCDFDDESGQYWRGESVLVLMQEYRNL